MIAAITKLYRRIVLGYKPGEGIKPGQIVQAESDCRIIRGNKAEAIPVIAPATAQDLTTKIRAWLATQQGEFTLTHAAHGALGVRRDALSYDEITNIGSTLLSLGCTRKVLHLPRGRTVRMWSPPAAIPSTPAPRTFKVAGKFNDLQASPAQRPERRTPKFN